MDTQTFRSLTAIVRYLRDDERKHWEEAGRPPKDHIYHDIMRVASWLQWHRGCCGCTDRDA